MLQGPGTLAGVAPWLPNWKEECRLREPADLGFFVHLCKRVPQSNHITSGRFGGAAARVLGAFREVQFQQKFGLVLYSCDCVWAEVREKLHNSLYPDRTRHLTVERKVRGRCNALPYVGSEAKTRSLPLH